MSRFLRLLCIGATAFHRNHSTAISNRQVCHIDVINSHFFLFCYIAENRIKSCRKSSNFPFPKPVIFFPQQVNSKLPALPQIKSPCALSLFIIHNVRYQTEVSLNQDVSGIQIALLGEGQTVTFFLLCQRLRERTGADLQRIT